MEIYLIRHTSPLIDKGICYGRSDIPLAGSFQAEAAAVQDRIAGPIDIVYSSPLKRCMLLARKIRANRLQADTRLLELDFGDWEMKRWNELDAHVLTVWMNDFVNTIVPGGENFVQLYDRVVEFHRDLARQDLNRVAIVTHAGVIRSYIANLDKIPLEKAFDMKVAYGEVILIRDR